MQEHSRQMPERNVKLNRLCLFVSGRCKSAVSVKVKPLACPSELKQPGTEMPSFLEVSKLRYVRYIRYLCSVYVFDDVRDNNAVT